MSPIDQAALVRAVEAACRDPADRTRVEERLNAGEPWVRVAAGCAASIQHRQLGLKPWEQAPCIEIDQPRFDRHADELRRKLLSLGLSVFEPDILAAIAWATKLQKGPAQ